jgi:hypothetical protein
MLEEETDALELITEHGRVSRKVPEVVLVATKVDKLPAKDRPKMLGQRLDTRKIVPFSVDDTEAVDAVWRALLRAADLVQPPRTL